MSIFENPFYILGATIRDNRSKINELAEEKSLLSSSDDCTEARNILTNPRKRLSAEVRWFPGLSPNNVKMIVEYVMNPDEEELDINSFHSLAKLNILKGEFDHFNRICGYCEDSQRDFFITYLIIIIKNINTVFEEIDFDEILLLINEDRSVSGFPQIEDTKPIEKEIRQMRLDFQDLLNNSLSQYVQEEYIEIINRLTNECIDENEILEGVVINDLLESYELQTKNLIEKQAEDIIALAKNIKYEDGETELNYMLDILIQRIEIFDRIAQPLQLKARSEGTRHKESENVAHIIRGLAIELHNNHTATDFAIKLTSCLKSTFAELDEFAQITEEDSVALDNIRQKQQAEKKEHDKMLTENTSDKNYSVTVIKARFAMPPYCTCCFKPTDIRERVEGKISETYYNTKETRSITLDFPVCADCLKHRKQITYRKWLLILLTLAISTGLFALLCLTNTEYNTLIACYFGLTVFIYIISGNCLRLPYITRDHSSWEESVRITPVSMKGNGVIFEFTNWRYAFCFAKANNAELNISKSRSTVKNNKIITSLDHPYSVAFSVLCLVLLVSIFIGPSMYQSIASNSQAKPSAQNNSNSQSYSNNNTSSSRYEQMKDLENELDEKKRIIDSMENELANIESDLEYYDRMLNTSNNNYYADKYNGLLEDYEYLYYNYESEINEYNRLVNHYNSEYVD